MTPIVVANWKMQLGVAEAVQSGTTLLQLLTAKPLEATVVVCPGFISLPYLVEPLKKGPIALGAQDVFWQEKGAYTGEVSPRVLHEIGANYVIIGHSERRQLGETDTDVGRKLMASLVHHLQPIVCVGESADERAQGRQEVVVQQQLEHIFRSAPPPRHGHMIMIAYEPIWAIGTGEAADPKEAEVMRQLIQQTLRDVTPAGQLDSFRILYGGSASPENVAQYVGPDRYDGALVGGASLDPHTFYSLISACAQAH